MENGDSSCVKKARVESPIAQMKQDVPEEGGALAPAPAPAAATSAPLPLASAATSGAGAAAREEVAVRFVRAVLHCPRCTLPLKPPIFQCGAGHLACGSCHGQLPIPQCHSCDHGGAYVRCPAMDAVVSAATVPCPNEAYGCGRRVAYCEVDAHRAACPHAPCACSEPGCAFLGSPAALLGHLAAAPHSWPVDKVRYGETLSLRVPEAAARRLLVAEEGDGADGGVFLLSVGAALRRRAVTVTVACVRARAAEAAAAAPRYTCKMWANGRAAPATGKVESVMVDMEVPSRAAIGGGDAAADDDDDEAMFLAVPRKMLHGVSKGIFLGVRISKVP
ncbi:hypothetical protein ACP4OV_021922 [Aristida adscensionis]